VVAEGLACAARQKKIEKKRGKRKKNSSMWQCGVARPGDVGATWPAAVVVLRGHALVVWCSNRAIHRGDVGAERGRIS
jgi:hypothetical protein